MLSLLFASASSEALVPCAPTTLSLSLLAEDLPLLVCSGDGESDEEAGGEDGEEAEEVAWETSWSAPGEGLMVEGMVAEITVEASWQISFYNSVVSVALAAAFVEAVRSLTVLSSAAGRKVGALASASWTWLMGEGAGEGEGERERE